jgi:hypothetical protein
MKSYKRLGNIIKRFGTKLILGAFFISAIMVLIISTVVNRQAGIHVNTTFQLAQNHFRLRKNYPTPDIHMLE